MVDEKPCHHFLIIRDRLFKGKFQQTVSPRRVQELGIKTERKN